MADQNIIQKPIEVEIRDPNIQEPSPSDLKKKIDRLDFYIQKTEGRLRQHQLEVEKLIREAQKEKQLVEQGLKLLKLENGNKTI